MPNSAPDRPRVVSMVPAGTEIVAALGGIDRLAAVSHDCDWPAEVRDLARITQCEIDGQDLSSLEVERWVERTLAERGSLYTIDAALLRRLAPDAILSQQVCDVCAPTHGSVAALAATLEPPPRVVNLEPSSLEGILDNIHDVAEVLGDRAAGVDLVDSLRARIGAVRNVTDRIPVAERPRVFMLEWLEPIYAAGHWGPEIVQIAGGVEVVGEAGRPSTRLAWERVVESAPEVLVLACCGYGIDRTLAELPNLAERAGWAELPAVRDGRVFAIDGSAYLSRPGPRIVDTLEILAGILHPERFPGFAPARWSGADVRAVGTAA